MIPIVSSKIEDYSDLSLSFKLHPKYADIRPITGIDAIKNSIKNILLTSKGERPFNPFFGCSLRNYLFELAGPDTESSMREEIYQAIEDHEPRVKIKEVTITDDSDRNAYNINLTLLIIEERVVGDISLTLQRLR
jgi:phage baseplate assembly protein W